MSSLSQQTSLFNYTEKLTWLEDIYEKQKTVKAIFFIIKTNPKSHMSTN